MTFLVAKLWLPSRASFAASSPSHPLVLATGTKFDQQPTTSSRRRLVTPCMTLYPSRRAGE
jgi:hypothetical protein